MIRETERAWGLGHGGWWTMWERDQDEAMDLLGWWWAHTDQDERADAARKASAPKPPTPKRVTGGPARRVRSR